MSFANRDSGYIPVVGRGMFQMETTTSYLCDFTNSFQHSEGTKFIIKKSSGTSKASGATYEIYLKSIGLIPNYSGHIPGFCFRYGETFGNDTVNAKRWLKNQTD